MSLLNILFILIIFSYVTDVILEYLNSKMRTTEMPVELKDICDENKYKHTLEYSRANTIFGFITSSFNTLLLLLMLAIKGFAIVDEQIRLYFENPILIGVLFFAILAFALSLLGIPFSIYRTFTIEKKFGFNKTTVKTYISDTIKSWILGGIIGGGLFALIIWLYSILESSFWLWAWLLISVFSIFMAMFYTSLILPLFNKLKPLEDGELRQKIEAYSKKVHFKLNNIYVMNGSKRSSKANAFFSGLGPAKKIVLFDTLIAQHDSNEIVSVLAHEVGHYKKKHSLMTTIASVMQMGVMLYIFSLVASNPTLHTALGSQHQGFHLSLLTFAILYGPVSMLISIAFNYLSRRNEYQADAFAKQTADGFSLQNALKKISLHNLSNLKPHPLYVFFHYSHPPLLERLKALNI